VKELCLAPDQLAKIIVDIASDKKASDILMLDIRAISLIADYFVLCTGANARQIQAIAKAIDEQLAEIGVASPRREGEAETGWVLLDYGDIIVHIFGPAERDYYRLERLWGNAATVVYVQ